MSEIDWDNRPEITAWRISRVRPDGSVWQAKTVWSEQEAEIEFKKEAETAYFYPDVIKLSCVIGTQQDIFTGGGEETEISNFTVE